MKPSPIARFEDLASRVGLPNDLLIQVGFDGWQSPPSDQPNYFLRVVAPNGSCNVTGDPLPWNGRKWRLSQFMTDSEVVATAFKAYLTALEHEAREQFTFDGQAVYDSHVDVHELVRIRKEGKLDGRH